MPDSISSQPVGASATTAAATSPQRHTLIMVGTLAVAIAAYWYTRNTVPELAARTLSIFIIAAVFWAAEVLPLFATAFVVLGLNIVFLASDGGLADQLTRFLIWLGLSVRQSPEVLPAPASVYLPLAKDIILLFMGGFLLSAALTKHGIDQVIASTVLRPFTHSPLRLLYGVLGISAFFSMWMSNTATAAMMIAIITPMLHRLSPDERFRSALVLAVPFGANIGGIGTPIGTPPNAIAYGALHAAGYHITFLKWVLVATPLAVLLLAGVGLLLYACFRSSPGLRFGAVEPAGALSTRGKMTLMILGATVLLWLTSGQHGLSAGATALLAAGALTALRVLDRRDVDSIDWDVIILMWGGLSLGIAMQQSGLIGYVGQVDLTTLPGGTWGVALVIALLGVSVSTFMSNTATAALLVPMALALSIPGKEQFAMLAALACSFAMAMPVSTPPNAMAYATGEIGVREMIRTGGLISIAAVVLMLLGYQIMVPLVF